MLLQLFYGHLEIRINCPYQTNDFCSYLQVLGYKPSSKPSAIELKDLRGWSQTVRETQRLNHSKWASEMVTTSMPCSQTLPFTSLQELLCLIIWVSIVMCGTWSSLSILLQKQDNFPKYSMKTCSRKPSELILCSLILLVYLKFSMTECYLLNPFSVPKFDLICDYVGRARSTVIMLPCRASETWRIKKSSLWLSLGHRCCLHRSMDISVQALVNHKRWEH